MSLMFSLVCVVVLEDENFFNICLRGFLDLEYFELVVGCFEFIMFLFQVF